jgi:hypothetical protein
MHAVHFLRDSTKGVLIRQVQRIWIQLRLLDEVEEYIAPRWMEDENNQNADEELADAEK